MLQIDRIFMVVYSTIFPQIEKLSMVWEWAISQRLRQACLREEEEFVDFFVIKV